VPFDLAAEARRGVGAQAVPDSGVKLIDGLEQADISDLHKILDRFRAPAVRPDTGLDQAGVALDQDLADRGPLPAVARHGVHLREQIIVR
jgi:hypothetical protein